MNQKAIKVISFMLVIAMLFSFASCSLFGGGEEEVVETTTEPEIIALSEIPTSKTDTVAYFNRLVNRIKAVNPGVKMEQKRKIENVNAINSKGEIVEVDALVTLAKGFIEELDKKEETVEYGTDLTDFLPLSGKGVVSELTDADVISAECTQDESDEHFYNLTIVLNTVENPDKSSAIARAFDLDIDKEKVLEQFQDFTDNVSVSNYSTRYSECTISIQIDKQTDAVTFLSYVKRAEVTSDDVLFTGELSSWGDSTVTLSFIEEKVYKDFVWDAPTTAAAVEG